MRTVWKVVLGLFVVVPLAAFVAGSFAASADEEPAPRHTIEVRQPPADRTPPRAQSPSADPSDDDSGDSGDEVEVVTPYDDLDDDLDDDHGGDRPEDHGDDHGGDDSGHGGGSDDSGHGGGDD
jgi:hypothetical protein